MRALASLIALTCALYTRYGFPSEPVLPGLDRASSLHVVSSNSTLTRPTDFHQVADQSGFAFQPSSAELCSMPSLATAVTCAMTMTHMGRPATPALPPEPGSASVPARTGFHMALDATSDVAFATIMPTWLTDGAAFWPPDYVIPLCKASTSAQVACVRVRDSASILAHARSPVMPDFVHVGALRNMSSLEPGSIEPAAIDVK